jgi:hypothetical protein
MMAHRLSIRPTQTRSRAARAHAGRRRRTGLDRCAAARGVAAALPPGFRAGVPVTSDRVGHGRSRSDRIGRDRGSAVLPRLNQSRRTLPVGQRAPVSGLRACAAAFGYHFWRVDVDHVDSEVENAGRSDGPPVGASSGTALPLLATFGCHSWRPCGLGGRLGKRMSDGPPVEAPRGPAAPCVAQVVRTPELDREGLVLGPLLRATVESVWTAQLFPGRGQPSTCINFRLQGRLGHSLLLHDHDDLE